MTGDSSVATVTRALEGIPGVREADVDLAAGTARVTTDGDLEPTVLRGAVHGAGYDTVGPDR